MQGAECEHGLHRMMKQCGIHWAVRDQVARRGGFKGAQLMSAPQIDGLIQSLRDTEQIKVDNNRTGDHATGGYIPSPCLNVTPLKGEPTVDWPRNCSSSLQTDSRNIGFDS